MYQRKQPMSFTNPIYKTITETVPEFFFVFDLPSNEIKFVSPRFFDFIRQSPEQQLPLHLFFRQYIHTEDQPRFDQFFHDLSVRNEFTARIELRVNEEELKNIKWIEIHTHPVEKEDIHDVTQVVGHILDITERKKRFEVLKYENQKLDSVIKILSHDLRAPFSQVYMLTNIIRDQMTAEEQERFGNYLGMLEQLGQRSLTLLESMLRLTALKEETKHLEYKKIDARDVVKSVAEQHQLELQARQQLLHLEVPNTTATIKADRLLLEQALNNLISNAMKFTPNGGELFLRLRIPKPERVVIEVQDSGIGIAQEDIPDLFKEFTRIRRRGIRGEKPVGLGLAICSQIIKLHKGKIDVESAPGKGTRFILSVPN